MFVFALPNSEVLDDGALTPNDPVGLAPNKPVPVVDTGLLAVVAPKSDIPEDCEVGVLPTPPNRVPPEGFGAPNVKALPVVLLLVGVVELAPNPPPKRGLVVPAAVLGWPNRLPPPVVVLG